MENNFQYIESEGVKIAAFIDVRASIERSSYLSDNVLFFAEKGNMNIRFGQQLFTAYPGQSMFVKKYTEGTYFKTWAEEDPGAIIYGFLMKDAFIREAIREIGLKPSPFPSHQRVYLLKQNQILKGFFDSIAIYLKGGEDIDKELLKLKTREAILGILKDDPENLAAFSQFAHPERAELAEFMEHHYVQKVSVEELARMSGRSLSTFKRDFKQLFNETPHRWVMKKRLLKARDLLLQTPKTASQIYLEVGFEDLAHFSRKFKKEFGKTPTEAKAQRL
jgi:AraC-like DNA-binding protein